MKRLSGALLTLLLALFLLPAVVLTLLSFLPSQMAQAIFQQEPAALSGLRLSTEQFVRALSDREYGRQFYNSAMLTGVSLALAMPVALGAGLFLSRLPRRWQRALLALYVLSLLSPFQIIMLPVYKLSLLTGLYAQPMERHTAERFCAHRAGGGVHAAAHSGRQPVGGRLAGVRTPRSRFCAMCCCRRLRRG